MNKQWRPEALLRLLMFLFLSLGLSGLLALALAERIEGDDGEVSQFPAMVGHTIIFHVGTLIFIGLFLKEHAYSWRQAFGLTWNRLDRVMGWAVVATAISLVCAWILGNLSAMAIESVGAEPTVQTTVQALQKTESNWQRGYMAFVAVLLAPLVEELLFRGILFTALVQYANRWTALIGSSVMFGVIHANLMTFVPLTFLAIMLTFLYERTGNLLAPIFTHALFNLVNFIFVVSTPMIVERGL